MQSRYLLFLLLTALFVPLVLLAEPYSPQPLLGLATLGYLLLFLRGSPVPASQILLAILIATTGEVLLSLVWGLYEYEHALIPLYVPVGHGIFYLLAAESAQHPILQHHGTAITRTVLFLGTAFALLTSFYDPWGLLWWIAAGMLILRSRNPLLLSSCFALTMALELLGTALGNWQWTAIVPGLGLRSGNPPSGVGLLYVLLDLLTVSAAGLLSAGRLWTRSQPVEAASS